MSYFNFLQSAVMNKKLFNLGHIFSAYLLNFNSNLLNLINFWIIWIVKVKFHPRTGHEDPEEGRGTAVLFL